MTTLIPTEILTESERTSPLGEGSLTAPRQMWPWNKDLPTADGRAEFQIENGKMTGGQILLNELTDEEGCGSQLRPYLKSRMKYIGINLADHWSLGHDEWCNLKKTSGSLTVAQIKVV